MPSVKSHGRIPGSAARQHGVGGVKGDWDRAMVMAEESAPGGKPRRRLGATEEGHFRASAQVSWNPRQG